MDRIRSNLDFSGTGAEALVMVRFGRELGLRTLVLTLLLMWPLILFGRPAYIADSAAYAKGGKVAVEFVMQKLEPSAAPVSHPAQPPAAPANNVRAPSSAGSEIAGIKGARSIAYSVAAYVLRSPGYTLIALVVVQTLLAAFVCVVAAASAGIRSRRDFGLIALAMAAATSLPTFTAFALPDVFAGILVASQTLLFCYYERLSPGVRVMLVAIAAFAVAAHASILPLAFWLVLLGTAIALWRRKTETRPAARLVWLAAPLLIGAFLTAAAGFVAFGETSVVAKRYPHALARSVSDGPARWYLEKECRTPRYAVCEVFGTHIPSTVSGFLFKPDGLGGRATPEQMDRIRAEESEIVLRSAMAYPGTELGNLADHVRRQFFGFGVLPTRFGNRIQTGAAGEPAYVELPNQSSSVISALNLLTDVMIALCALWVIVRFRELTGRQRTAMLMIASVLVVNAVFCVLASGISDRYQARIAWALPLFILSFAFARRGAIFPRLRQMRP